MLRLNEILCLEKLLSDWLQKGIFIIAEAGVNHNGSLKMARKLIDAAVYAGADAVKFQTFRADNLVLPTTKKADYQLKNTKKTETQHAMLKKLELDAQAHKELISYCNQQGISFLSSPFDLDSIELLNGFGLGVFKIPSGEITNLPYLRQIGKLQKKVLLSTGMADLQEVTDALAVLTSCGTLLDDIVVLHCHTEYPTSMHDVNLLAMRTLAVELGVKVGYSDHTLGIEVPIAAAALGAVVIEKHFTLDRSLPGPDHLASLNTNELKSMVQSIRNIEEALGDEVKKPSVSERENLVVARKSIIAADIIKKGELFTEWNLTVMRPGHGINPMLWDTLIGKRASVSYLRGEMIDPENENVE